MTLAEIQREPTVFSCRKVEQNEYSLIRRYFSALEED